MKPIVRTATFILLGLTALVAITACGGRKTLTNLPARELYEKGMQEYQNKKFYKSIDYFSAIVYNYPGESLVDTAQFYVGMSYFGQKDYKLASVEFNRLLQNYPSSIYAANAQYMKAVCLYEAAPGHYGLDQTDLDDALQQLEDFVIDNPESELVADAKVYISDGRLRLARKTYEAAVVYVRLRALKAATIYFQRVVDEYTDTEYGPLAAYGIADVEYQLKHYDKARTQFDNFATAFPDHDLAAKARQQAEESAYKDAAQAVKAGDIAEAATKLQAYLSSYPNGDKADDVREKLENLPPVAADSTADSQTNGQS